MVSHHVSLHIALIGFGIALVGAIIGFSGFYIEERWLSVMGFCITGLGVIIGFVSIVYGWMRTGKQAISGGILVGKNLRVKIKRLWK